jgi:DnaJ-like protein
MIKKSNKEMAIVHKNRQNMWTILFIISMAINVVLPSSYVTLTIFTVVSGILIAYHWLSGIGYQQKMKQVRFEDLFNDIKKNAENFQKQQNSYSYNYSNGSNNRKTNTNTLTTNKVVDAFSLFKLSTDTPPSEIKKKYKKLALKWHPDKWVSNTKENQEIAERNFKKINNAYSIIKQYKNIK